MKTNRKAVLTAILIALILAASVGGTLAYLIAETPSLQNVFQPTYLTSEVVETMENNVKSDVKIKNTGNVDAYIRATVIITWQDDSGNVLGTTPVVEEDYSIAFATGWTKADDDGFYYYGSKVSAGDETGVLISECKPLKAAPVDGYTLHVEILGSAIQADGMGVTSAQAAFAKARQSAQSN